MEVIACQCAEGFGLPHSHVPERIHVRNTTTGRTWSYFDGQVSGAWPSDIEVTHKDPPSIRIWVNWKEVAKALMGVVSPTDQGVSP